MFVKICGLTNREDAFAAVDAGAGALGFVFYPPSPRSANPAALAPWFGELPQAVWKVGVFVDESPEEIERIAASLGLDVAQLHGNETPDRHPRNIRVWKAQRINGAGVAAPDYPAEAIVLDGPGSGRIFDWSLAAGVTRPVVLAGGLTPDNVRAAIAKTNPWGVDTASGVEAAPGRKDHAKMKAFIKAALRS